MYHPSLDEVKALARDYNVIPVWRELPADLETPVSVYLKLHGDGAASFLLESVRKGDQLGRYSFLGFEPRTILTASEGRIDLQGEAIGPTETTGDPLAAAEAILAQYRQAPMERLPRFCGGMVGYMSYDATRFFERVPEAPRPGLGLPDAVFMFADNLVVFDHVKHQMLIVVNAHVDGDPAAAYQAAVQTIEATIARLRRPLSLEEIEKGGTAGNGWTSNVEQSSYEAMVRRAKEYIRAGDIFQVVPSQRLSRRASVHPFRIYRALRMLNPSPYMFYLELPGDLRLIGSSPEVLVQLEGRRASVRPIAGTRRRGADAAEDAALAEELLADPKERAEHVMLVDLGRNDLGRVCRYGSVQVSEMMTIEYYSHVMHIVSNVHGELRPDLNAFDLMRATFPAGTVSGAPKVRAMEIIAELEGERRGPYAGAVGYFSYSGNMDTCIAIRTIVMQGDVAYVQAGGGVVADSDPTCEYQESMNKARALAEAVDVAERGEF